MESTQQTTTIEWGRSLVRGWRALAPVVRVGVVSTAVGLLGGFVVALLLLQEHEELRLTVAPQVTEGTEHLAIDGRRVLLKAVLEPRPGHDLTYHWSFGDESEPVEGPITAPFGVSAVHTYPESPIGTVRTATLTISDKTAGEQARTTYAVRFVEDTIENKRSIAMDDALWALHASMERGEDYVRGPVGSWNAGDYPIASTAMALMAFEVNGFDARDERRGNPYEQTVDRALRYVLGGLECVELKAQPAGDPDSNGNGIGLTVKGSNRPVYEVPLAAMALVASQAPDRVARFGPEGVRGRTFKELVTDMLDFLAFAQVDKQGPSRGGWRYTANHGNADMSVTQWPVLAFMSARKVWGLDAPEWVKSELRDHFLKHVQGSDGGFDYEPGRKRPNVGLTGAGLIALAFVDVPAKDERVRNAATYIETNWKRQHLGNFYNMYAVMKGALLTTDPIETFGEHDWLSEYVEHFYATQRDDGSWGRESHATGARSTAWPALTISKDVFATSRPSTLAWGWILSITGVLAAAVLGLVLLRRRAMRPALTREDGAA